jgi:hypothetical protein
MQIMEPFNMNNTVIQLVKQYVTKTLDEPNGISTDAYNILMHLMQEDRDFAMEMHDVVDKIATSRDRYFLLEDTELEVTDGYEL